MAHNRAHNSGIAEELRNAMARVIDLLPHLNPPALEESDDTPPLPPPIVPSIQSSPMQPLVSLQPSTSRATSQQPFGTTANTLRSRLSLGASASMTGAFSTLHVFAYMHGYYCRQFKKCIN